MNRSPESRLSVTPTVAWGSGADIRKGLRAGALIGAVAAAVRIVYWLRPHPTESFPPIGDAAMQIALPLGAGVIAGAVVGALWPWRRHRTTSVIVGLGTTWLFVAGIMAGWHYPQAWTLWRILASFGYAVLPGVVFGASIYDDGKPVTPESMRQERAMVSSKTSDPIPPWELCPCCGYRTFMTHHPPATCALCEWEEEASGAQLSLAEAQRNFQQHLSIYDPLRLPEWRTSPPAAEEAAIRRQIMSALDAMELAHTPFELTMLWDEVDAHFEALSALSFRDAEVERDTPESSTGRDPVSESRD